MNFLSRIARRLGTAFRRIARGEYYELQDSGIVFHKFPFGQRLIANGDIKHWTIIPEMGADFVKVALVNGEELLLTDKRNDLIGALNKIASDRKVGDEFDRLSP